MKILCMNCEIYFDTTKGHICSQRILDYNTQPVPCYHYPQPVPCYHYPQPVPQVLPFWDDVMPCGCKWNSLTGESRICRLHWQEFKKNES